MNISLKKFKKIVAVMVVNIVIILLLSELIGVIVFYAKTKTLFYKRVPLPQTEQPAGPVKKRGKKSKTGGFAGIVQLHPYFGYITRPGTDFLERIPAKRLERLLGPGVVPPWADVKLNNFGFASHYRYPFIPEDDSHYIIGIFGGSVAQWFSLQGTERLRQHLRNIPGLKGKEIVFLNFAQPGYKQPQQLQLLTYFLSKGQVFHAVINIDGFNEIALSYLNYKKDVDLSMPSRQHLFPLVKTLDTDKSPVELETLADIKRYTFNQRAIGRKMARTGFASVYLFLSIYEKIVAGSLQKANRELDSMEIDSPGLSGIHVDALQYPLTKIEAMKNSARYWRECSILMNELLCARGVLLVHVLQPNQYFSRKPFLAEERRVALSEASPYKYAAENGYPYLIDEIKNLEARGVHIFNAVPLFDNIDEIIYSDSCCHYNQLGNEILADFIASCFKESKNNG